MREIVQIIGRATRDAPGKPHAQFTNPVAEPGVETAIVADAVSVMISAISGAMLMEQVPLLLPTVSLSRSSLPQVAIAKPLRLSPVPRRAKQMLHGSPVVTLKPVKTGKFDEPRASALSAQTSLYDLKAR